MFKKSSRFAVAAGLAFACATQASAGIIVVDGTIEACSVDQVFAPIPTDGATEIPITSWNTLGDFPACPDMANVANQTPFSINLFGEEYSSMYLNDDGIISFGSAVTDDSSTSIFDLAMPVIAPYFGAMDLDSLRLGYNIGVDTMWLTWRLLDEAGLGAEPTTVQVAFQRVGTDGDFDLLLNYVNAETDPAQAGIADGNGSGYLIEGGGIAGAYIGDDNDGSPICTLTSIACAVGFGVDIFGGDDRPGFFRFEFRDGVPINVDLQAVPIPAAPVLFLTGLAALGRVRSKKRSKA